MDERLTTLSFASPLGWICMAASAGGLCLLHFCGTEQPSEEHVREILAREYPGCSSEPTEGSPLLLQAKEAVLAYLSTGTPLPHVPLDMSKGTAFRRNVWEALCRIPHGETRSYLEIARSLGKPGAPRAVGQACGSNPIALFVPCHRVLTSGGRLGGYSGGLDIKRALLELEGQGPQKQ